MSKREPASAQGRLAEVIALRGGKASPEAPFVIEHREALIYMLCEAAELEHGIMCQYLFAAFSLKQRADEGLSAEQLEAVLRWRKTIAHVATEEMLHLALVHNLLSAVGAAPHLARPNLPAPAQHYPAGVNLTLVPFGEPALKHFMFLERPEGMELKGAKGIDAPVEDAVPLMSERDIVPRLQDFATVGHLYRSIEHGIAHLAAKFGEQWLFVGPRRAQATSEDFHWPELIAVTDTASAQQAIDTILEQGEGARGDWQDAHFGQFVRILDEYRQLKQADPSFDPVRPVLFATARPSQHADDIPLIGERVTSRCVDLFNVTYEVLLQTFERYFAHTEETDAQLATLAEATLSLMLRVLKPLGDVLTTLPVGPEHPGLTAGPSFELFYETDYLMPHREAAWTLLEERLREAGNFCGLIEGIADESLCAKLEPIGDALNDVADSLAAHFADWGSPPRYPSADAGTDGAEDVNALLERASELAQSLPNRSGASRANPDVIELFTSAYETMKSAAAIANAPANTEAFPATYVAGRIVNSVLRPLADALASGSSNRPQTRAKKSASSKKPSTGSAARLDAAVWSLAKKATELRAQLKAEAPVIAALAEASACLQELAVALAAEGKAEKRLERLRKLQAGLPCAIQSATNGPYLVTNAANLRNWLGEPIPVRPQMALCRCGQSKRKPFCDGTHAQIGFTADKDPKRVPDRRDTYLGQQVTVFDNRGICQHSGFCTDRLAAVFHVDSEPFVTPSGGRMDEIIRAVRDCPSGALSFALDGVEARESVDHHDLREPTIEVTKDGPYRISGGIPLLDPAGQSEPRNQGASLEHYALCRCGHSQNKPFCSGMHWYTDFHDPVWDAGYQPSIFEWAGGLPALTRMTRIFYEKLVPEDPLLAPLFANMSPDHPQRVAAWLGEVFGGPTGYSEDYGGYQRMLSQHLGKGLTEEARARWVELISRAAQEAGLPADPEFRSAFGSYLEWGSRLALENSQPRAKPPEQMPVPHWSWGASGAPGSRISPFAPESDDTGEEVALPGPDEPVSFDAHIKPLFRERDRQSMTFAFDLWSYDDVQTNGDAILERLRAGTMPCDGAWPQERVDVFERWTKTGMGK